MIRWLALILGAWVVVLSAVGCGTGSDGAVPTVLERTAKTSAALGTCGSPTLTASPASPQLPGTSITLTAGSATCTTPLYEFWMLAPGAANWTQLQSYSSTNTYTWNTTNSTATGNYIFELWVEDSTSSGPYDAVVNSYFTLGAQTTCTAATVTPTPASPQAPGAQVSLAAGSTGCSTPEYEFWLLAPGASNWTQVQPYSSTSSYAWDTTSLAAGTYTFEIWAKDSTSTTSNYDAFTNLTYLIGSLVTCTDATASASPTSPQPEDTVVTISGGSSACTSAEYQFWLLAPGAPNWTLVQPYSSNSTFTWNTASYAAGTYSFEVWARDATSSANYDSYAPLNFTLTPASLCTAATATATPLSPQAVGTPVTVNAGSSSCSFPQYEFWLLPPGASNWTLAQSYSSSSSYAWTTTGLAPGQYIFEVFARDLSSTAYYDTYLNLYYTLQ